MGENSLELRAAADELRRRTSEATRFLNTPSAAQHARERAREELAEVAAYALALRRLI